MNILRLGMKSCSTCSALNLLLRLVFVIFWSHMWNFILAQMMWKVDIMMQRKQCSKYCKNSRRRVRQFAKPGMKIIICLRLKNKFGCRSSREGWKVKSSILFMIVLRPLKRSVNILPVWAYLQSHMQIILNGMNLLWSWTRRLICRF